MARSPAICGHCKSDLRIHTLNTDQLATCPSCYEKVYGYVYPAWYQDRSISISKEFVEEGDASCFFHDNQRAKNACDSCGKFICNTCEIEYAGGSHCPECIGNGKAKGLNMQLSAKRYDRIAFLIAMAPLTVIFWFIAPITAPLALYLSIKHWARRDTMIPYNRWRFVVASLVSLGTITTGIVIITQLILES